MIYLYIYILLWVISIQNGTLINYTIYKNKPEDFKYSEMMFIHIVIIIFWLPLTIFSNDKSN